MRLFDHQMYILVMWAEQLQVKKRKRSRRLQPAEAADEQLQEEQMRKMLEGRLVRERSSDVERMEKLARRLVPRCIMINREEAPPPHPGSSNSKREGLRMEMMST